MTTDTAAVAPRRRIRSGIAALCCSLALIGWIIALIYLAAAASSNDAAGTVAYVMFFASWVVIPVLAISVLVLAILALLLNPVGGKILGALAIVAPIVAAVLAWIALGSVDLGMFSY